MAVVLDHVVPFGRTLMEYERIFDLSRVSLSTPILGVADGPASFNAEWTAQGGQVISLDPIYELAGSVIEQRFLAVVDGIIRQVEATPDDWVWGIHSSPAGLRQQRELALRRFLTDYDQGKRAGRYYTGSLPHMPFADHQFDLALCSHFLFLYSGLIDLDFHLQSLKAMLRVAREVQVFPLLTLAHQPSPHLEPVLEHFRSIPGLTLALERTTYELQKGGHTRLRLIQA